MKNERESRPRGERNWSNALMREKYVTVYERKRKKEKEKNEGEKFEV